MDTTNLGFSSNLMFERGVYGHDAGHDTDLAPVSNFSRLRIAHCRSGFHTTLFTPIGYGNGEQPISGFSEQTAKHAGRDPALHSMVAVGGSQYSLLAKGTQPYTNSMWHAKWAKLKLRDRYRVGAICCVHGEGDNGNASYDLNIRTWQSDYETDLKAITGQPGTIPMFHSQHSNWTKLGGATTSVSAYKMVDEFVLNPDKTVLVCPKYFMTFQDGDGLHLDPASIRMLGSYYGKAYRVHVLERTQWYPMIPSIITRTGPTIDIEFVGTEGDIVLDTENVTDPNGKYGFEYFDDGTPPAISSVSITGSNSVRVTLASTPTGANKKIRYAYTGISGNRAGWNSGPRGCLRDSCRDVDAWGNKLYNWCIHFNETVT